MSAANPQLAEWRAKVIDGTVTVEELALAIAALREDRRASAPKPKEPKTPRKGKKSPTAAPAQQVDLEDLINQQL